MHFSGYYITGADSSKVICLSALFGVCDGGVMGSVINEGPQTEVNHKTIMKGKHRPHPTPAGALIQQLGITQGEFFE